MSCCTPTAAVIAPETCANCGKEGTDIVKLKNCTACFLVKYCGVDCQKSHRKLHKRACKKRAAELKDEELYAQGHERPESDFCPLCLLAIPFPMNVHSMFYSCCSKLVCNGCAYATHVVRRQGDSNSCPFCRAPSPENDEEGLKRTQRRVAAKDPEAMVFLGNLYKNGSCGLEKNVPRAMKLWTEAAELGSTTAHADMGIAYYNGWGVAQDKAKGMCCWESAAMQGHATTRHTLGIFEFDGGNYDRAVRHLLISAKMGLKESLNEIKELFVNGHIAKAQFAEGLKGYQDAVEEMKSSDREVAATLGLNKNKY
ncbi:hypothetical protein THAOC_07280 [Thalassiosira oceanica]|uniref:MYND-type domain-containing protein n=1 Tax=Thalassiosira oceanica TaxID=159749 RepID=K0T2B5_THAOC|nr:hypothetical protein THAOC_07280 [Thalassiosira oceanica]|eukprot:EJK71299.1 hypothetical protein THAOC_07280 [Thalassiosira oceanica]